MYSPRFKAVYSQRTFVWFITSKLHLFHWKLINNVVRRDSIGFNMPAKSKTSTARELPVNNLTSCSLMSPRSYSASQFLSCIQHNAAQSHIEFYSAIPLWPGRATERWPLANGSNIWGVNQGQCIARLVGLSRKHRPPSDRCMTWPVDDLWLKVTRGSSTIRRRDKNTEAVTPIYGHAWFDVRVYRGLLCTTNKACIMYIQRIYFLCIRKDKIIIYCITFHWWTYAM